MGDAAPQSGVMPVLDSSNHHVETTTTGNQSMFPGNHNLLLSNQNVLLGNQNLSAGKQVEISARTKTIKRPMNAFLIFCKRHRGSIRQQHPDMDNRSITKVLGEWWAKLDDEEREQYTSLAKQDRDEYLRKTRYGDPESGEIFVKAKNVRRKRKKREKKVMESTTITTQIDLIPGATKALPISIPNPLPATNFVRPWLDTMSSCHDLSQPQDHQADDTHNHHTENVSPASSKSSSVSPPGGRGGGGDDDCKGNEGSNGVADGCSALMQLAGICSELLELENKAVVDQPPVVDGPSNTTTATSTVISPSSINASSTVVTPSSSAESQPLDLSVATSSAPQLGGGLIDLGLLPPPPPPPASSTTTATSSTSYNPLTSTTAAAAISAMQQAKWPLHLVGGYEHFQNLMRRSSRQFPPPQTALGGYMNGNHNNQNNNNHHANLLKLYGDLAYLQQHTAPPPPPPPSSTPSLLSTAFLPPLSTSNGLLPVLTPKALAPPPPAGDGGFCSFQDVSKMIFEQMSSSRGKVLPLSSPVPPPFPSPPLPPLSSLAVLTPPNVTTSATATTATSSSGLPRDVSPPSVPPALPFIPNIPDISSPHHFPPAAAAVERKGGKPRAGVKRAPPPVMDQQQLDGIENSIEAVIAQTKTWVEQKAEQVGGGSGGDNNNINNNNNNNNDSHMLKLEENSKTESPGVLVTPLSNGTNVMPQSTSSRQSVPPKKRRMLELESELSQT